MWIRATTPSDPASWQQFVSYNCRDVEVELAIQDRLAAFPVPDAEWATYALDQAINDRGIHLDLAFVDQAVRCDEQHRAGVFARAWELTGLANPNSPIQLKQWLTDHDCEIGSLTKADVTGALATANGAVRGVLQLRGDLAKSSVKKYQAMQQSRRRRRACARVDPVQRCRTHRQIRRTPRPSTEPATQLPTRPLPCARACAHRRVRRGRVAL